MEVVKFSDLATKEVINYCDGKCLGYFSDCDLKIDPNSGQIKEVILAGRSGIFRSMMTSQPLYSIPWQTIIRVGIDTIIVSFPQVNE